MSMNNMDRVQLQFNSRKVSWNMNCYLLKFGRFKKPIPRNYTSTCTSTLMAHKAFGTRIFFLYVDGFMKSISSPGPGI